MFTCCFVGALLFLSAALPACAEFTWPRRSAHATPHDLHALACSCCKENDDNDSTGERAPGSRAPPTHDVADRTRRTRHWRGHASCSRGITVLGRAGVGHESRRVHVKALAVQSAARLAAKGRDRMRSVLITSQVTAPHRTATAHTNNNAPTPEALPRPTEHCTPHRIRRCWQVHARRRHRHRRRNLRPLLLRGRRVDVDAT